MDATQPGTAIILDQAGTFRYTNPLDIVSAETLADVRHALHRVDQHVAQGHTAIGFVSYEAAPAFDAALRTHPPANLPLVWFGIYNQPSAHPLLSPLEGGARVFEGGGCSAPACACEWTSTADPSQYHAALERIRDYIAAGDTYQVNFTFPLTATFEGDALAWFRRLCQAQAPGPHGDQRIFIDTGRFQILSISPELFFTLDGYRLTTRPMKGTRRRGRWQDEDQQLARELAQSAKDQAENVMIVDMIRNDLGRVCKTGSVLVEELFAIERYETVWQMTSTISGESAASVPDIFAALFPSASVTGAPKVRTMEIIRELESQPRGVYCGAIGWWGPGRQAKFSVGIRTATIDRERGNVVYPVGSGVTWDSSPAGEYQECLDKAAILAKPRPEFDLLETMVWDGQEVFLLQRHLDRLASSAAYFGMPVDIAQIRKAVVDFCSYLGNEPRRLRLLVNFAGEPRIESFPPSSPKALTATLSPTPIDPDDVFLYHKTTHRKVYEEAKAACPDADEVILWNSRGELTECTIGNLVLEIDGRRYTPPIECGLLPGTFRAELLERGEIEERVLMREDLERASQVWMINSVRRWVPIEIIEGQPFSARQRQ